MPTTIAYVGMFPREADALSLRDLGGAVSCVAPHLRPFVTAAAGGDPPVALPPMWIARSLEGARADLINLHCALDTSSGPSGGRSLPALARFLGDLRQPLVATLHSVPLMPTLAAQSVISALAERADVLVASTAAVFHLLVREYGVPSAQIRAIPVGQPALAARGRAQLRRALQLEGDPILITAVTPQDDRDFAHLLQALPALIARYPGIRCIVMVAPRSRLEEANLEDWPGSLVELVAAFALEQHLQVIQQPPTPEHLLRWMRAADVFVSASTDRGRAADSVLDAALRSGTAIVASSGHSAAESLAEGRGLLAAATSPTSLTRCIQLLLGDPMARGASAREANAYGRRPCWSAVGSRYARLFEHVLARRAPRRPAALRLVVGADARSWDLGPMPLLARAIE